MLTDLSALPTGVLVALGILVFGVLVLDPLAMIDLYRRPAELVAFGSKWIWLVLMLFLNLLCPVLHLLTDRKTASLTETPTAMRGQSKPGGAADVVEKFYGPQDHRYRH